MESYNLAVLGSSAVGKSAFIQHALSLPREPASHASSVRYTFAHVTYMVTLLELDLDYLELHSPQPIQWPKQISGHFVPRVDAALLLYDVTSQESTRDLSQTVAALANVGLPSLLVACKCDRPKDDWQVDADAMANHKFFRPCLANHKVSVDKPETSRACLQCVLQSVKYGRDASDEIMSRRRAQSVVNLGPPDAAPVRPLSQQSKCSRASSDFSLLRATSSPSTNESYRVQGSRSPRSGLRTDRPSADFVPEGATTPALDPQAFPEDKSVLQQGEDGTLDAVPGPSGFTFDELVDRLLEFPLSRADHDFADIFLCLYRKIAAPSRLFGAVLQRLDAVRDDVTVHYLTETATQLGMIEVVARWVSTYPGDFARPSTRRKLEEFVKQLSVEPVFSIASAQIRWDLCFHVVPDDDTCWEKSDEYGEELLGKTLGGFTIMFGGAAPAKDATSGAPFQLLETPLPDRGGSSIGCHSLFQNLDEYAREAALLQPSDHLPLNKFRFHSFLDISHEDIADELTRIDWIMFSSIRIRDFVRHVSFSLAQRARCKSLRNMDRMINHFNHIAKWVANMILLRYKAKHRAQMLEKFMHIALRLRQLNNYNGLAAVLAGINGSAIHRLTQTRALVPADVQKRFARLVLLMGTQKSHFAYRLAWDNTSLPRIPFIPLHRRDLVMAEEGSKSFLGPDGDRINWKKFEVLGGVLLPIMKSQGTAYPNLAKHDVARELILGCRILTDEEDIYQRSLQLENASTGPFEPARKIFPWFVK